MSFKLGIDNLLLRKDLLKAIKPKRVAFMGHPASVNSNCVSSLSLLIEDAGLNVSSAFGPQHGMKGDKQDNMIESADFIHPEYKIPVFSLYSEVRKPTRRMLDIFDVLIVDLQDIGCRAYTYITSLAYMMNECSGNGKKIIMETYQY